MVAALAMPRQLSLGAWARVALRLAAMAGLLAACIPLYYAWKLLRIANPWPRLFLGTVSRIAGVRITVTGPRPVGPTFLLANHVSWIDIPALSRVTGSAFVGHDGLASMPVLEWLCRMNDTVFIARHDRASVARQVQQVREALAEMHALTIFPEGTTSDGTGLLPFKSSLLSAFEPLPEGIAVQPVLLDYGPEAARIAWVGEEHGLDNFLRVLARRRPVRLTVAFQHPLSGDQLASRKTIAASGREALAAALSR
ncbi:lyso-ornithine lipid acyltransferase [Novosphingobium kunmingense]|uniref:Lyso-ornithine lipid acyltransferase n=1 Tax=Novosphingobium kunmingense TaxID=1211806 RepID=A0A2N0I407_9SPHN|nr:lysophospholipid acyltransferase family protein [Novosphingobium kunmingense]PKB25919.1 lyso-ornithine lipid acyltransferase [Novosphingobium kunmingense]